MEAALAKDPARRPTARQLVDEPPAGGALEVGEVGAHVGRELARFDRHARFDHRDEHLTVALVGHAEDHVEHSRRQPGVGEGLGQQAHRARHFLGRLDDDGAAG